MATLLAIFNIAIPSGLLLDIAGFILILRYGHAFFLTISSRAPRPEEGSEGSIWLEYGGPPDNGHSHRLIKAKIGAGFIFTGFVLQLIGSAGIAWLNWPQAILPC